MEAIFRALRNAIVGTAELTTTAVASLHHLANAACERTVVVEQKSEAAAALSAMEHRHTVATRLVELQDFEDLNPDALAQADLFLANYRAQRAQARRTFIDPTTAATVVLKAAKVKAQQPKSKAKK